MWSCLQRDYDTFRHNQCAQGVDRLPRSQSCCEGMKRYDLVQESSSWDARYCQHAHHQNKGTGQTLMCLHVGGAVNRLGDAHGLGRHGNVDNGTSTVDETRIRCNPSLKDGLDSLVHDWVDDGTDVPSCQLIFAPESILAGIEENRRPCRTFEARKCKCRDSERVIELNVSQLMNACVRLTGHMHGNNAANTTW